MKVVFSNSALVAILLSALLVGVQGQDTHSSSSQQVGAQPQSEPASPSQNTPQQEPPADQQQTQPPAQAPQSAPAQPSQAAPDQSQSKEQGTEQRAPSTLAPPDLTSQTKPHPTVKSKSTRKKRSAKAQSTDPSGKVVIRNGGLRESSTQLSPGGNDQQAESQRNVTSQLLATTDANLKKVSGQQLTPAQQSMLDQVNAYVRQSKAASDAGDIPRAHTLAVKAQLLSNELARK